MKKNHKLLIIKLILISSLFFNASICPQSDKSNNQTIKTITSEEAYKMIQENADNPDLIIIDVRTKEEFNNGHIKNAINIDLKKNNFKIKINKLDKNKTYLIYCRSGSRSESALKIMEEEGFKEVYNFGGVIQWQEAGYELVK